MRLNGQSYWLVSAMTLLLATIVTFGAGEILVRIARPQLTYSKLRLLTGGQYTQSDFLPFTLKKKMCRAITFDGVPRRYDFNQFPRPQRPRDDHREATEYQAEFCSSTRG